MAKEKLLFEAGGSVSVSEGAALWLEEWAEALTQCENPTKRLLFARAMMRLAVVRILQKMMPCIKASLVLLLKSVMRRELGPLHVEAEVCPKAKVAEKHNNRDTVG